MTRLPRTKDAILNEVEEIVGSGEWQSAQTLKCLLEVLIDIRDTLDHPFIEDINIKD